MGIEATVANDVVDRSNSPGALKPNPGRWQSRFQRIPSLLSCIFFLILCITFGELFEVLVLFNSGQFSPYPNLVFLDAFAMLVVILPAFYYFVYRPIKLSVATMAASEQEIKFLSQQLILLGDREKRAVASDLHDQFGQSLTMLQFSMEELKASFAASHPSQIGQFENMVAGIAQLGDMVRNVSTRLSPAQLEALGLVPTLEWAVKDVQSKGGCFSVDFVVCALGDRLHYDLEIALYRIFQEALNNITKHSEASRVKIVLTGAPSQVSLSIEDNGVGFDCSPSAGKQDCCRGIGLLGMRERIKALGGEFSLVSTLGKGTRVKVSIPRALRAPDDSSH